jgi:hypothetical protein
MTFADFIAAAQHGAASIYHDVLAVGSAISAWESDPAIRPLIMAGVVCANGVLSRFTGIDPVILERDILIALKGIAALDPTIKSGG